KSVIHRAPVFALFAATGCAPERALDCAFAPVTAPSIIAMAAAPRHRLRPIVATIKSLSLECFICPGIPAAVAPGATAALMVVLAEHIQLGCRLFHLEYVRQALSDRARSRLLLATPTDAHPH